MKKQINRYFCHIRIDVSDSADISDLNDKINIVLEEWVQENADNGIPTDIGWDWSKAMKLDD